MDEAQRIYRALFKETIPPQLRDRFYQASSLLFGDIPKKHAEEYEKALSGVWDLEALEVASRLRNALPLLVWKFQLMVYLAETLPQNWKYYIHSRDERVKGMGSVLLSGGRTGFKLFKGILLLGHLKKRVGPNRENEDRKGGPF